MGVFIIIVFLFIISALIIRFVDDFDHPFINNLACTIVAICIFALIFCGTVAAVRNYAPEAHYQRDLVRAEMIQTQVDAKAYDNDNDVGKYELYQQVVDWNTSLEYQKAVTHDFWIGIFHPDYVDKLPYITFGNDIPLSLSEV